MRASWLAGLAAAVSLALTAPAPAADVVKMGALPSISDAGLYIAIEKGFFQERGITVEVERFASAGKMNAPPTPVSPFSINLADNIARQGLVVDQILPLHGRVVPVAELYRTIGWNP